MIEILIWIGGYWLVSTVVLWIWLGFLASEDKKFREGNFISGLFISPFLGWLLLPMIVFASIGEIIYKIINKKNSEKR